MAAMLGSSCDHSYLDGIDDIKDFTYTPVVAFPLVNASLGIDDAIDVTEFSFIEIDENHLISFVYNGKIFSVNAEDLFVLKNQSKTIRLDNIHPTGSGTVTLPPIQVVFEMSFDQEESLQWLSLLEGFLTINAQANQLEQDGYSINVQYRILNGTDRNGNILSGNLSLNNADRINLSGSSFDFSSQAGSFIIEYTFTLTGGTPTHAPYSIDLFHYTSGMKYDLIKGYIGRIDFPIGNANIPVSIFTNSYSGSIAFANPYIEISINNSFGLPVELNVVDLYGITITGETFAINGPAVDNPWNVMFPASPEQQSQLSQRIIGNESSNIYQVTQQSPQEFYINLRGLTHSPGYEDASTWIRHNSNLKIDVDIRLPLDGKVNFFNIRDTLSLNIDSLPQDLEWIELKMNLSNGFPVGAQLEVYMLNEAGMILDTLFKQQPDFIRPAAVDAVTGLVSQPVESMILEMLDEQTLEKLRNCSAIIFNATLNTFDHQNNNAVKILNNYQLDVQMGIRAKTRKTIRFSN